MTDHSLLVYWNNQRVGQVDAVKGGTNCRFTYDSSWTDDPENKPISWSIPLAEPAGSQTIFNFFDGLLTDNGATRRALAQEHNVGERNPFDLLSVIGRDCAGALQIVPAHTTLPDQNTDQEIEWLSEADLSAWVHRGANETPDRVTAERHVPFSLAGAQQKTVIVKQGDRIGRPVGDTPSTHILKPKIPEYHGIVENEVFCLRIAQSLGLPAANAETLTIDGQPVFCVERFDRAWQGERLIRLHQEDLCQAMGRSPADKYQRDRGPSVEEILRLLMRCDHAHAQQRFFVKALQFNFLIGGGDAHAKNYSIVHGDKSILSPLYDIASSRYYFPEGRKQRMAMKIGGEYRMHYIMPRHWLRLAQDNRLDSDMVIGDLIDMSAALPDHAMKVRDEMIAEGTRHPILDQLIDHFASQCKLTIHRLSDALTGDD